MSLLWIRQEFWARQNVEVDAVVAHRSVHQRHRTGSLKQKLPTLTWFKGKQSMSCESMWVTWISTRLFPVMLSSWETHFDTPPSTITDSSLLTSSMFWWVSLPTLDNYVILRCGLECICTVERWINVMDSRTDCWNWRGFSQVGWWWQGEDDSV